MITYNTNTPILFYINNPDATVHVFSQVRKMKPAKLYIAANSPCTFEERVICELVKEIVSFVDWGCELFTFFRDENLVSNMAFSQAISWFFESEPEGIMLEDNCLPADMFFGFCSYMLNKYRNDERVGHINGSNFQQEIVRGDGSYYFSTMTHAGGWAGWRKVWKDFDLNMEPYSLYEKLKRIDQISALKHYKNYWNYKYNLHLNGKANIWEFQYAYLNLINNRLSITPNINLVTNIDRCEDPAHFFFANIPPGELEQIVHPSFMVADIEADIHSINFELNISTSKFYGKEFSFIIDKLMKIPEKDNYMRIPKIIHQIYFDMSGVPDDLSIFSQTWKEKHLEWEYRFWNKETVEQFLESHFQGLIPLYRSFPMDVQRWDFVRYLILYHFGGLYVDLDYECLEPLDTLLWNSSCCMGLEPASHAIYKNKPYIIGNALMAVAPQHDFFYHIIKEISNRIGQDHEHKGRLVLESTGAFMLNRIYDAYEKKDDVTLLPAELVTPLAMEETQRLIAGKITTEIVDKVEKAFAIHYYFNSWISQIY